MLHPLSRRQRVTLLQWSLIVSVSAVAVLVLLQSVEDSGEANAGELRAAFRWREPSLPMRPAFPSIAITHDPFAREAAPQDSSAGNATVEAVIVGAAPRALVQVSGRALVVGIGSSLLGSSVVAIDAAGVDLRDGRRLPFSRVRR